MSGLFRSIHAEERLSLVSLGLEDADSYANISAVHFALDSLSQREAGGHVKYSLQCASAWGVWVTSNLCTGERSRSNPRRCKDGFIEVEAYAAGLNYKDVMIAMGIVPSDEHMLGGEAAGVVTRSNAAGVEIGQRVIVYGRRCKANRVHARPGRLHRIPNWMTFEEVASISIAYMTAMCGLFELAGVEQGKTVLIHSAAGGCRDCLDSGSQVLWYGTFGCEPVGGLQADTVVVFQIFVNVSNEETRRFLQSTFSIHGTRVFNSRNAEFAPQNPTTDRPSRGGYRAQLADGRHASRLLANHHWREHNSQDRKEGHP
ncbi:chaperonin 10-like protein [Xylariomycetidae sp. FL2044]|nr:chaperonin 10-like protein [Xylariomycetidae sp. FL2044]